MDDRSHPRLRCEPGRATKHAVSLSERPIRIRHDFLAYDAPVGERQLNASEQAAFFDEVLASALEAETQGGAELIPIEIAGIRIALRFAGLASRSGFVEAFDHVRVPLSPVPFDAVLHVWDHAGSGIRVPRAPVARTAFTDRGDIWGMGSREHRSAFHWFDSSLNCFNANTGIGVRWVPDCSTTPNVTKGAPLRTLLHWVLGCHGVQMIHAAAVATQHGAVLLTGKGGSGKTTTAITAIENGLAYLGDDYVAIRSGPKPTVHSIYCTAKVISRSGNGEKDVVFPGEDGALIVREAPIAAVVAARIRPIVETVFTEVSRSSVLRAASFTTLSQLPHAGQEVEDRIAAVIDSVHYGEVSLGTDPNSTVREIRDIAARSKPKPSHRNAKLFDKRLIRNRPLLSVIIPVHNGAHFLAEAVQSIVEQDYEPIEIIVVDDGSTDDLSTVVENLPVDVRFFHQEAGGPASARNRGIRDASGDLLAFLDVDDLWPKGTLRLLHEELLRAPELFVVRGYAQVTTRNPVTGVDESEGNPAESFPDYIGAGLYRKGAFDHVGLFDATMWFAEDTDWHKRFVESGLPGSRLPVVTLTVRRHGGNMTAQKTSKDLHRSLLVAFKKSLDRARARTNIDGVDEETVRRVIKKPTPRDHG